MRRQSFFWTYMVIAILLMGYGAFFCFYYFQKKENLFTLGLISLIAGSVMVSAFLIAKLFTKKKPKPSEDSVVEPQPEAKEEPQEEPKPEPVPEPEPEPIEPPKPTSEYKRPKPSSSIYDRPSEPSGYVRLMGYGSVLRIEGSLIVDMRSNTYYRIEGNIVRQDGYGPAFEISGNRIRGAYGGYLYEISGDTVRKEFHGFYGSFNGTSLTKHDLSERYEVPSSLSTAQKLVIVALLFG